MISYRNCKGHRLSTLLLLMPLLIAGCSRAHYRKAADADAYSLVAQAASATMHSPLPDYTIEVDRASRMFDPFCPDCPPMPPDDPVSHQAMHCVDGKRAYPYWHANGDTVCVESPFWSLYLPLDDEGRLVTDRNDAVDLALVHSPVYQTARESLYFSALDVSLEQFSFDTQFFAGYRSTYTASGRVRSGGSDTSVLDLSTRGVRATKLFASGGELVVGFANTLLWQFSSNDTHTATTLIDFAFLQPLLRAGGRDVVLESLTQSERNLLAEVRSFERFRRSFFLDITTGGSSLGGVGGYFGLLRDQQIIRNQESNIIALQNSLAQLEAFFEAGRIDSFQVELTRQALFSAQSSLLSRRAAYERQLDSYKITLGLPPQLDLVAADSWLSPLELIDPEILPVERRIMRLQSEVGETIEAILSEQIISPPEDLPPPDDADEESDEEEEARHHSGWNARERLVLQLAPATDQDPIVVEPELLPPQGNFPMIAHQADGADEPSDEENSEGDPGAQAEQEVAQRIAAQLVWSDDLARQLRMLRSQLDEVLAIQEILISHNLPRARADVERLQRSVDDRFEEIVPLQNDQAGNLVSPEGTDYDNEGLRFFTSEDVAELPIKLDEVEKRLSELPQIVESYQETIDKLFDEGPGETPTKLFERVLQDIALPIAHLLVELSSDRLEITLAQARARVESITFTPIEIDPDTAYCVAQIYRRDWMNARASLVDRWRLIQVRANDLESNLDVVFNGDIGNTGDNPFRLRDVNGRLQVGLEFDSPLTRRAERNSYRTALINYQQARREYYAFEDEVARSLRDTLRQLAVNRSNLELRRGAIHVAIKQVDLSLLRLQEPPKPGTTGQFGATTARDLVTSLSSLLSAQNDFVNIWVSYESQRRILDFEMGTMQLDSEGRWIDPGPIDGRQWKDKVGVDCLLCRPSFAREGTDRAADGDGELDFFEDQEWPSPQDR